MTGAEEDKERLSRVSCTKQNIIEFSLNSEDKTFFCYIFPVLPVTAAERSETCTFFVRSEAGIVGSNPTEGMDV
jgi:hypothetical protein